MCIQGGSSVQVREVLRLWVRDESLRSVERLAGVDLLLELSTCGFALQVLEVCGADGAPPRSRDQCR